MRKMRKMMALLLSLALWASPALAGGGIGTDLNRMSSDTHLYARDDAKLDCTGDNWCFDNPAAFTTVLDFAPEGNAAMLSSTYYSVGIGDFEADLESVTATIGYKPLALMLNFVNVTGSGGVKELPGVDMEADIMFGRIGIGLDLSDYVAKGLSVGIMAGVPTGDTTVRLGLPEYGLALAKTRERQTVNWSVGAQYATGQEEWLTFGALVTILALEDKTTVYDLETGNSLKVSATNNTRTASIGASILPGVPLGLSKSNLVGDWFRDARIGFDLKYLNFATPGEGHSDDLVGYAGLEVRLIPDAWNPLNRFMRPYFIVGQGTNGDYGVGAGLYGNPEGPLAWLSLNAAYSRRKSVNSIGESATIAGASLSIYVPF